MQLPSLFHKKSKAPKEKKQKRPRNPLLDTPEYKHFRLLRYINMTIILSILVGAGYLGYFLYEKIYTTIGQVQNILVIDTQIQGDIIDFGTLDRLEEEWQLKYATSTPSIDRDPFSAPPVIEETIIPTSTPSTTPEEVLEP